MAHVLEAIKSTAVDVCPIRRALLSVSDKEGLVDLASALSSLGVELLSTGGTAAKIREAGIPVVDVSDYTGSPEILDGRVKTLHPRIHGGLLSVRGNLDHEEAMRENGIKNIDLVVMNLYPFENTVASGAIFDKCVENIDIGGPSMLRSSAKNHAYVAILSNPSQYEAFTKSFLAHDGATTLALRKKLAAVAFATSAAYDSHIARYFAAQLENEQNQVESVETVESVESVVPVTTKVYTHEFAMKYGCNPHQKPAGIYSPLGGSLPFKVVNGVPGYVIYTYIE